MNTYSCGYIRHSSGNQEQYTCNQEWASGAAVSMVLSTSTVVTVWVSAQRMSHMLTSAYHRGCFKLNVKNLKLDHQ